MIVCTEFPAHYICFSHGVLFKVSENVELHSFWLFTSNVKQAFGQLQQTTKRNRRKKHILAKKSY